MNLDDSVGVEELARVLNVTSRRIQQLAKEGVIPRQKGEIRGKYPLGASISAYIANLQRQVGGGDDGEALTFERARLAREQADKIAMQNAVSRKDLAPVSLIVETNARIAAQAADILDGVGLALKRSIPGIDSRVVKVVEAEIRKVRSLVADSRVDIPTSDGEDDEAEEVLV